MIHFADFGSAWAVIHLFSLFAAVLVRIHIGGRFEGFAQAVFLVCLTAIGLTTVLSYRDCLQMWPLSAVTLAIMIVVAVVDFSSTRSYPVES